MNHPSKPRNEYKYGHFVCDKKYINLRQYKIINKMIVKIGTILSAIDRNLIIYNKALNLEKVEKNQ